MTTFHDIKQRTPEWDKLRAGKLTASVAKKIVTPTGKASTQYKGEIARIIAEMKGLQEPEFLKPTYWMERGINLEAEALAWFEVETDLTVKEIGFVSSENNLIGASPDGLIREFTDRGGNDHWIPLELKCPKPSTHIQWLIDGGMPKEHIAQVHFQMALCEAPYAYFCSYNPEVAPLILKVEWSDYTDLMVKGIEKYTEEFWKALTIIDGGSDAEAETE
jgi:hypothetical protein